MKRSKETEFKYIYYIYNTYIILYIDKNKISSEYLVKFAREKKKPGTGGTRL